MNPPRFLILFFLFLVILTSSTVALLDFIKLDKLIFSFETEAISISKIQIPVSENINNSLEKKDSYPEIIKAVYATSWSMSKEKYVDYLINLASSTEINAAVIDIKDFSGYVAYDTKLAEVERYGAKQLRMKDLKALIQKLHDNDIYTIARISVFQDHVLANARPDLAVLSRYALSHQATSTQALWSDKWGLCWTDPSAKEVWKYNALIARDALQYGFDEINFDYVRFPSDGILTDMVFPSWDQKIEKHLVIRDFFKYLRSELPQARLSVDLFGLSTVGIDDLGIGQVIEDGYEYFDFICPMVYPSHYAFGFSGYPIPSEHPYEVVKKSMNGALARLDEFSQSSDKKPKLRPWLQDFSLTVQYDAEKIKLEIKAVKDSLGKDFNGFMLWNPNNFYTEQALNKKD